MRTTFKYSSRAFAAAIVAAVVPAGLLIPVQSASAAEVSIQRVAPVAGESVSPGLVTFEGRASDAGSTSSKTHVTFAVDLSGSTSSPNRMDCNGDDSVDSRDDLNNDGSMGDVIDCQIAAIVSLNSRFATLRNAERDIRVSIVGYGSSAAAATMDPENGALKVAPNWTGRGNSGVEGDVLPRVDEVAASLQSGYIGEFRAASVGTGTNFNSSAQLAIDTTLNEMEGDNGFVFFFSDGQASASSTTLSYIGQHKDSVRFRTFAVGTGAGGCADTQLARMAAASDEQCTYVEDIADLVDEVISSQPSTIESLTVTVDGREFPATIDPIGNWSAAVQVNALGSKVATIRVIRSDGSPPYEESWEFTVDSANNTYVALGDSFASGEGVRPYLDQRAAENFHFWGGEDAIFGLDSGDITQDYACHRAEQGWVAKTAERQKAFSELDFRACTGARIVDITSNHQHRKEMISPGGAKLSGGPVDRYNDPQIHGLESNRTSLVTLSIGGNDAAFGPVIEACMNEADCQRSDLPGTDFNLLDWSRTKLALLSLNYVGLYGEIRARAPRAMVVAATYPRLIDPEGYSFLNREIDKEEADFLNYNSDLLARIIEKRANEAGFFVADVRDAFDGHGVGSDDPWIEGVVLNKLLAPELVSSASFHPNQSGSDAYARVVRETIEGTDSTLARSARSAFSPSTANNVDDWLVDDPEGYLAAQPPEFVEAVAASTFQSLEIVLPSETCDGAPTNAVTEFVGNGFVPGSDVTVRVTTDEGATEEFEITADEDGFAFVAVSAKEGSAVTQVVADGLNPEGGIAVATATVPTADSGRCPSGSGTGSLGSSIDLNSGSSLGSSGSSGSGS